MCAASFFLVGFLHQSPPLLQLHYARVQGHERRWSFYCFRADSAPARWNVPLVQSGVRSLQPKLHPIKKECLPCQHEEDKGTSELWLRPEKKECLFGPIGGGHRNSPQRPEVASSNEERTPITRPMRGGVTREPDPSTQHEEMRIDSAILTEGGLVSLLVRGWIVLAGVCLFALDPWCLVRRWLWVQVPPSLVCLVRRKAVPRFTSSQVWVDQTARGGQVPD